VSESHWYDGTNLGDVAYVVYAAIATLT